MHGFGYVGIFVRDARSVPRRRQRTGLAKDDLLDKGRRSRDTEARGGDEISQIDERTAAIPGTICAHRVHAHYCAERIQEAARDVATDGVRVPGPRGDRGRDLVANRVACRIARCVAHRGRRPAQSHANQEYLYIFAEYVKIPAKNLWAVDERRVRPEIAAMYDPFGNAVHATTKVDFLGQRVAIFGAGAIGLFSILLLRRFGAAKIIAIDVNSANLAMANELGAHETILIPKSGKKSEWEADYDVVERIMELTYGKGVDVSMEMSGAPASLNNCIESTRRGGHIVAFGIKDGDMTIPAFSRNIVVRGLTIHGIIGREFFKTWQIAQRMLSDKTNGIQDAMWDVIMKKGKGTILDFHTFTPENFEKAMNEHPKIVFKING